MFDALSLLFSTKMAAQLPDPMMLAIAPIPEISEPYPAPVIAADSAFIIDLASGKVLFEQNADKPRPIASLTKLMTAIVARDSFGLDDIVTVSAHAAAQPPAKIWLRQGEHMTVEQLLHAALIASGNDAATALAEHFPGGIESFVAAMNAKAKTLGLRHTHFANPIGFDDAENYSSARDISLLAQRVLRDPVLRGIVETAKENLESADGIAHAFHSTNHLFGSYLDIRGLKTGTTPAAGQCLAAIARGDQGNDVLAIVLDSPSRFNETKIMLEWALANHSW